MRMWMVEPKYLCRSHLLGEHRELHTLVGTLREGKSIQGYLDGKLVEVHNIASRHDALVAEFRRRGWPSGFAHATPLNGFEGFEAGEVDVEANRKELIRRCFACAINFQQEELCYA